MANKIDQFWEIFKAVAGETSTVTESTNAIAKSDRTKVESYFSNVIDQFTFETEDYNRLRKFMIDLFASFRTQSTVSLSSSDPHALTNSNLDELFRSMGYDLSASLRGFDENPLEQKVQFFLDLVNLYKVKGTPQSLVDVLQYYGVTEVDIYEFFLKKDAPDSLFFDGKAVAGTTVNASGIGIPYNNLTSTDPHWLYTAQQILQLDQLNKINLPSKSPYLGVQPTVDLEGAEMAIIERYVQDQYDSWQSSGTLPPPNAEITYIGETRSLLELYLSCIYMFNKLFDAGYDDLVKPENFMCYDGTNVGDEVQILTEFDQLTKAKVETRDQLRERYEQYIDIFSRPVSSNFLVDENTAGTILNSIDPTLKSELDGAGQPVEVLYSLLKDLALWVRANIGFGFVNFGFILFGIQEFFKDLKPVIDFFKPYRARLLLLESLQVRNRLFNTIIVEDEMSVGADITFHDYLTGDSKPCCNTSDSTCMDNITVCNREFVGGSVPSYNWRDSWQTETLYAVDDAVASGIGFQWICTQAHTSGYATKPGIGTNWTSYWDLMSQISCHEESSGSGYSRDTYDCGSYHDIGAVTDAPREVEMEWTQEHHDHLRCPAADGTGFVVSELSNVEYTKQYTKYFIQGSDNLSIFFDENRPDTNYNVGLSLGFDIDQADPLLPIPTPEQYGIIVTDKQTNGFDVIISSPVPNNCYYIDWYVYDNTASNVISLDSTAMSFTVPVSQTSTDYIVTGSILNTVDINPSIYAYTITDKTTTSFKINLSGFPDSSNYKFEYCVCQGDKYGINQIAPGNTTVTIPFTFPIAHPEYPVTTIIENANNTTYFASVIEKTEAGFTVEVSSPADSTNFNIAWTVPTERSHGIESLDYYQSGGFRDFDSEGTFDCTHGFDLLQITVEDVIAYLLQETGFYLLQEDGARIIL